MVDYSVLSACRGMRPRKLDLQRRVSRPGLVARLLTDRHVARFIVAPSGFGKSSLACEYAEVMYRFKEVFWYDCTSPCFLRDIDSGEFCKKIAATNIPCKLAVFDDIPYLDATRADAFSNIVDKLIDGGSEVICISLPTSDVFARRQADRFVLYARDLLLSDGELTSASGYGDTTIAKASHASKQLIYNRIPAIAWGGQNAVADLLDGLAKEETPKTILAFIYQAILLQRGSISKIRCNGSSGLTDAELATIAEHYLYLSIDRELGAFFAIPASIQAIMGAFGSSIEYLARLSDFDKSCDYLAHCAQELFAMREFSRACQLIRHASPISYRLKWLNDNARTIFRPGCIRAAGELFASLGASEDSDVMRARMGQAWRLCFADKREEAIAMADSVLSSKRSLAGTRALSAVLLVQLDGGKQGSEAFLQLGNIVSDDAARWSRKGSAKDFDGDQASMSADGLPQLSTDHAFWKPVACVKWLLQTDTDAAVRAWRAFFEAGATTDALLMSGGWILDAFASKATTAKEVATKADTTDIADTTNVADITDIAATTDTSNVADTSNITDVVDFIVSTVEAQALAGSLDLFAVLALRAYESAIEINLQVPRLSLSAYSALQQAKSLLTVELSESDALEQPAKPPTMTVRETHVKRAATTTGQKKLVEMYPPLTVRIFGKFDVYIGDTRLDDSLFRRRKVKTLLAILVLKNGLEMQHDRIAEQIWPESDPALAKRNLYTVWSELRRALTVDDGTCPYLIRQQDGLKLEDRILNSDVQKVNDFCRMLLAGAPDATMWLEALSELSKFYAGDLLPLVKDCPMINKMRLEYQTRVIDSLVSASGRLLSVGEHAAALWFAREAFALCDKREDVFITLMEAQIAACQRTAALDTYFACRTFLSEELGIDPSARLVRLYRTVIEEEAEL